MANYYPPVSFSFQVKIAGNRADVDTGFQEVSGLSVELPLTEVKEGGENRFVHRVPEQAKYQNLVLKRGVMLASSPLFDWCKSTLESDLGTRVQPKDMTVSLLDQNQKSVMRWSVVRAWPVKWTISEFKAQENAIAIETLEMSFQRIERKIEQRLEATGFLNE